LADLTDLGSLTNFDFTQSLGTAWFILQLVFVLAFVVGVIILIKWLVQFNVLCQIEERHGNNVYHYNKKGKLGYAKNDKKKITQRLFIFGVKKSVMFPAYVKNLETFTDGNGLTMPSALMDDGFKNILGITKKGKITLRLFKDGDEITVVPWYDQDVKEFLRVTKPIREQWADNLLREGEELFKPEPTFLERYGAMVMVGGAFIVVSIIFIMLFNKFDNLDSLAGALNNYAEAMNSMSGAIRETGVQSLSG